MKTICALLVLFLSTIVVGADALVTWPAMLGPYSDGAPFRVADVAFVTISWTKAATGEHGTINSPYVPTHLTITTPCGKYTIVGSYTTNATAHVPNATSANVTATYDSGVPCVGPQAPTNVTVH